MRAKNWLVAGAFFTTGTAFGCLLDLVLVSWPYLSPNPTVIWAPDRLMRWLSGPVQYGWWFRSLAAGLVMLALYAARTLPKGEAQFFAVIVALSAFALGGASLSREHGASERFFIGYCLERGDDPCTYLTY